MGGARARRRAAAERTGPSASLDGWVDGAAAHRATSPTCASSAAELCGSRGRRGRAAPGRVARGRARSTGGSPGRRGWSAVCDRHARLGPAAGAARRRSSAGTVEAPPAGSESLFSRAGRPEIDAKAAGELLQACRTRGCSSRHAHDRIPHVRLGRYVRFEADQLLAWARNRTRGPAYPLNRAQTRWPRRCWNTPRPGHRTYTGGPDAGRTLPVAVATAPGSLETRDPNADGTRSWVRGLARARAQAQERRSVASGDPERGSRRISG